MYKKFVNKLKSTFRICKKGQKGITGLETAIILIAFVTVASVLSYSVLSAGIFSAERGKETVYTGLEQAKASMEVRGSVYAMSTDLTKVSTIQFTLASVLSDENVDFGNVIFNYSDANMTVDNIGNTTGCITTELMGQGVTNPNNPVLGPDQAMLVTINTSLIGGGATIGPYDSFTVEVIPTSGASITIQRTMPGSLDAVNDLF